MKVSQIIESSDVCPVCGQTPCNCTHIAEGSLNEFAPGGNSASSYYAVTANFVSEFSQQKEEEIQDLIAAGWTKQDLEQAGTLQGQAADIAHFEQVRDGFLKGLKPGFDAYLQGDTQMKDQLGEYWLDNDLPLNQDWEKIYGEPWGDDMDEGVAEGYSLGKVLSLPELLGQIKHILTAKHPGIGWRMTMPAENTFLFSAQNDYDVWSMLVVEAGGDDWVSVGHGMVDPDGKPIIFDRQQLPMTLASASEIADEAIQTYHDLDLSDYADDEDYNQGVSEGSLNEFSIGGDDDDTPKDDPYKYPKPEQYRRSIDFFGKFEANHFDKEDMDDATGVFKGYWYYGNKLKQIAYFKFDNPRRTGSNDPGMGWYYEPQDEDVAEAEQQKGADYRDPPEANYGDDYQDMVSRVKKLAGLGPLKTQYDPKKRVYRNMPTATQPKK